MWVETRRIDPSTCDQQLELFGVFGGIWTRFTYEVQE